MRAQAFDWRRMPEYRAISLLAFVFLYAPLIILIVYAFNANRAALIWGGFSTQWFVKAALNDDLRRSALNSLIVAAIATPVSTLIAIPAASPSNAGGSSRGEAPARP